MPNDTPDSQPLFMPALKDDVSSSNDPIREPPSPGATHNGDAIGTAHYTDADLPDHQNIIAAAGNPRAEDDLEDVGWKKNYNEIPRPLIRRLPNEQLWMLIRRFDMVRPALNIASPSLNKSRFRKCIM